MGLASKINLTTPQLGLQYVPQKHVYFLNMKNIIDNELVDREVESPFKLILPGTIIVSFLFFMMAWVDGLIQTKHEILNILPELSIIIGVGVYIVRESNALNKNTHELIIGILAGVIVFSGHFLFSIVDNYFFTDKLLQIDFILLILGSLLTCIPTFLISYWYIHILRKKTSFLAIGLIIIFIIYVVVVNSL